MTEPTEDEHILGDLPELPDHVWTAALGHAFDPLAEPDVSLVPTDDLTGLDAGDDLAGFDHLVDGTSHDALGAVHDPFDPSYHDDPSYHGDHLPDGGHAHGGDDASQYDPGYTDHGFDQPGFLDSDGYF